MENRVFVLSKGEKMAFIVKEHPEDVLLVQNERDALVIATDGNPVNRIHETLRHKIVPWNRQTDRETYSRVVKIETGESVEVTVRGFRNRNHMYLVERDGKLALVGGSAVVRHIYGKELRASAT